MHRKEQEILAILGLILSVSFLVWSYLYIRSGRTYDPPPEVPTIKETTPVLEWTQKDNEVQNTALEFGEKVSEALLVRPNYDYIYNIFSEAQKEMEFGYDIEDARRKLEAFFGRFGLPDDIEYTAQSYNDNRPVEDWSKPVYIENTYRVYYENNYKDPEKKLTIIILYENDKYFINGIKFQ